MADLPPITQRWLADHHGVISTARLKHHGVGRTTIVRLIDAGALHRVAKGVFIAASAPQTVEQRCAVLCAAHSSGFITGPTAGALAGLRRMPRSASLHLSVRHGIHLPPLTGVHLRQTTVIWEVDRMRREDGIIVASWPRLAFDLAADLRQLDHLSVVEQLLHERRVKAAELVAIERRLGHPARPGSGVFKRTLESLPSSRASQSHPEVIVAAALRRRGIPIEQQARVIRSSNGLAFHIDLAVPSARWGIELDIHPEHRTLDGLANDARRRREMHLIAWQIETVSELDLANLESLADELAQLYAARVRELARPSVS